MRKPPESLVRCFAQAFAKSCGYRVPEPAGAAEYEGMEQLPLAHDWLPQLPFLQLRLAAHPLKYTLATAKRTKGTIELVSSFFISIPFDNRPETIEAGRTSCPIYRAIQSRDSVAYVTVPVSGLDKQCMRIG